MGLNYRKDDDLEFLQYCSEGDIQQLANYLIYDKDNKERIASEILNSEDFKLLNNQPDQWRKSWKLVAGELQHFGGDSIVNLFRGTGVLYKEILSDVCDKLEVKYNRTDSAYNIENSLIERLVKLSWEKMSEKEKQEALKTFNVPSSIYGSPLLYIMKVIEEGGLGSFQWSSWLAQSVSVAFGYTALSSISLDAAATFIGGRSLAFVAAPLAIAATIPLFSGVAYRVTMPSVIQIAYMRRRYEQKERF